MGSSWSILRAIDVVVVVLDCRDTAIVVAVESSTYVAVAAWMDDVVKHVVVVVVDADDGDEYTDWLHQTVAGL
jgi:hypothetical protein